VSRDRVMRRALWISVVYNSGAALLFAFPSSSLGRLSGLPNPVPPIYSTLVALFVALFAGVYGWLAMQPEIDRPMVALGAIGKAGAFSSMLGLWAFGELGALVVLAGTGDLMLAAIFTWWLLSGKSS
jgi:hypothetical protein